MPGRLRLVILLGLILVAVFSFGVSAGAAQDEVGAAQERLAEIRMETGSAYEAHDNAVFQLAAIDEEIAAITRDLGAAEEELAVAQGRLEERAAQMYKSGNVGFVDVLVGAEDFSDFANRLELWMRLLAQEREAYEEVLAARNEIAQTKAELETSRAQFETAVGEADGQMDRASGLEAEAQAYLDSLNEELRQAMEAEQAAAAEAAIKQGEKLRAEIAEAESQAVPPAPAPQPAPAAQAPASQPAPAPQPAPAAQAPAPQAPAPQAPAAQASVTQASVPKADEPEVETVEAPPTRNLAAEQAAADRAAELEAAELYAAEKAAAVEQARLAAEQAAAGQAAAGQAAAEEQARLQAAAEEAELLAALAQERAAAQAAAEEQAMLAAEQQAAAEQQFAAEQDTAAPQSQQYGVNGPGGSPTTTGGDSTTDSSQYGPNADQYNESTGAEGAQPSTSSTGAGGATGSGSAVVAEATNHMGTPYVFSPPGPCENQVGEDCSCHTMLVYQAFGISLPDSPAAQFGYGSPVSGPPMAGDLVFFNEDGSGITHVGIATGNGTIIHASAFAGYVTETPIDVIPGYVGARRLL